MSIINVKEFIGKVYSNYTIISFEYFNNYKKSREPFFKCKCKCGEESLKGLWSLRRSKTTHCKVCKNQLNINNFYKTAINTLNTQYRRQAINRNYTYNISKEEFVGLLNNNCYYCNLPPSNKLKSMYNSGIFIYSGIDRIDNSKGYIKENVVSCCINCNRAKSDMSLKYFKNWITNIYNKIINE